MEFKTMNAAEYRSLDADAFELRRNLVIAELDNADSKVPFADLNAEVAIIEQETERRNAAVNLRNADLAAVKAGAGATIDTVKRSTVEVTRSEDPFDTESYNRAFFDYAVRGKEFPAGLVQPGQRPEYVRADAFTTTSDVPHFIPTTLANNIISKMSEYGTIYNKATKLNVPGGYEISVWDYLPTASWVTEAKSSDDQKVTDASRISFLYHMLECKIAQSQLAQITSMAMFQDQYPAKIAEAMVRALEAAMVNGTGSGQPLGILKDTRLAAENKVTFAEADIATWKGWATILKNVKAPYRAKGEFVMTQATWDSYVDGMVDAQGQPIARVNYGVDGAHDDQYRLLGRPVCIVPEDILPNYEDAKGGTADTPCMLFGDLSNYIFNNQSGMRYVAWDDEDNNKSKQKAQLVTDGKLGDVNGLLVISAPKKA